MDSYFFGDCINFDQDLDEYYDTFERLSTIYISRNKGAIIIKNNLFSKNIGTFGGAISINSPDFVHSTEPYIIINGNSFEQNMAYLSGNAIYV